MLHQTCIDEFRYWKHISVHLLFTENTSKAELSSLPQHEMGNQRCLCTQNVENRFRYDVLRPQWNDTESMQIFKVAIVECTYFALHLSLAVMNMQKIVKLVLRTQIDFESMKEHDERSRIRETIHEFLLTNDELSFISWRVKERVMMDPSQSFVYCGALFIEHLMRIEWVGSWVVTNKIHRLSLSHLLSDPIWRHNDRWFRIYGNRIWRYKYVLCQSTISTKAFQNRIWIENFKSAARAIDLDIISRCPRHSTNSKIDEQYFHVLSVCLRCRLILAANRNVGPNEWQSTTTYVTEYTWI